MNDKKIYEGDIVRIDNVYVKSYGDGIGVINWDDFPFLKITGKSEKAVHAGKYWDQLEVIGNKYENFELLKEKEDGK